MITASAPGKLVMSGEYAVIDGAPAVSLAINRRAKVTVQPSDEGCVLEVITASRAQFPFSWHSSGEIVFTGEQPAERGTLLMVLLKELAGQLPATMPAVRIVIDSSAFYAARSQQKLGLGSSAAVCVALTAAVHRLFATETELHELCYRVHAHFQNGKGSGIDIATSLHGGVIQFQTLSAGLPATHFLNWPQGLYMLPVWTGCAASTGNMLMKLDQLKSAQPARYLGLMDELAQVAAQLCAEWQRNNVPVLLDLLALYSYGLSRLDETANVGIYSAEHIEFQHRAASIGAVYKPSGAGGGDFGLVFSDSSASIEQLAAEFGAAVVLSDWSASAAGLEISVA
jgi:phosphomevalonate kinase